MDDSKMKWCKNQKQGIEIIEPNNNLAKEYLKSANETLELLRIVSGRSNMWAATMKYYFEYFLAWLESKEVLKNLSKFLEKDKQLRIENQYYLKNIKEEIDFDKLTELYLYIKDIIERLDEERIQELIKKLKRI